TAVRRRRWRDVSLEALGGDGKGITLADPGPGPEGLFIHAELLAALGEGCRERLTERQRFALAAGLNGVPKAEVARVLGSNRNAVYKLTHDARLALRAGLEEAGFGADSLP